MNCEEIRILLPAYIDGELDVVRHVEIERHVEGCPDCAEGLGRQQELHEALGDPGLYHRAPAGLRAQIRASLQASGRRSASRAAPLIRLAVAAAVLLALGMGSWIFVRSWTRPSAMGQLAQAVVADHVRSLMPGHGPDVLSSDRHTVKPWFAGKLKFSPPVKDLADHGFPLVGGSLDYLEDHEAAVLVYHHQKHVINLYVWPAAPGEDRPIEALTRNGYHVVHWRSGGFNYWAVSDLNEAELREFARLLRE